MDTIRRRGTTDYQWPEQGEGRTVSWVANVVVSVDSADSENVRALSDWLNHADLDALRRRFAETAWRLPNAAQLLIKDQEDCYFRLWMIRDGRLAQYAPLEPSEEDDAFGRGL